MGSGGFPAMSVLTRARKLKLAATGAAASGSDSLRGTTPAVAAGFNLRARERMTAWGRAVFPRWRSWHGRAS
jgi:hypothetical protein